MAEESCNIQNVTASEQLQVVREKLQKFQIKMLSDFEQRISCMIEDVLQDIRQQELRAHEFRQFDKHKGDSGGNRGNNSGATWHNRKQQTSTILPNDCDVSDCPNGSADVQKEKKPKQQQQQREHKERRQLPDKVFVARESYLTALLQVEHMRTIYHIFYIILVMLLLNVVCHDYFAEGRLKLGLGTFRGGLQRLHWVMGVWLLEHVFVLALYYAFQGWALVRAKLQSHSEYTFEHP